MSILVWKPSPITTTISWLFDWWSSSWWYYESWFFRFTCVQDMVLKEISMNILTWTTLGWVLRDNWADLYQFGWWYVFSNTTFTESTNIQLYQWHEYTIQITTPTAMTWSDSISYTISEWVLSDYIQNYFMRILWTYFNWFTIKVEL